MIDSEIKESFLNALKAVTSNSILFYVVCGLLISYFYNLPIIKYSVTGDNEFRIYDVLGLFVLYFFYKYNKILMMVIRKIAFLKFFYWLLIWSGIMMIFTFMFSIINGEGYVFLQVILYWYHFWTFFLASLFVYLFSIYYKKRNVFIHIIFISSISSSIIVVLQNFEIVPFLWSDAYLKAYSFYSGTLGPNKIVLGMTSLFSFVLTMAVFLEKSIKINRILVIATIIINLYIVLLSGSRTTYIALIVFLAYFALFKPFKFIFVSALFTGLFLVIINYNPILFKTIDDVVNNRVVAKINNIENPNDKTDIDELYSKLGAGRDKLTKGNFDYILDNPQIIPFGMGFVNRYNNAPGLSAHNMYLQVIKELGVVGFVLYFGWLISYLFIDFREFKGFSIVIKGFIFSMLVALFFGEHLYIYRPLFGVLGLFLAVTSILVSILHKNED
jgi:O-Antigen ligase